MIDTTNIIVGALSQALETMAFMEIMAIEEKVIIPKDLFLTKINFKGPQDGCIQLLAPRAFAEMLAINFAALEDATENDCRDVLKELVNVTCGLVTPMMASQMSDEYNLTIPVVYEGDAVPDWDEFSKDEQGCVLVVEEHPIIVKMVTKTT